MHVSRNVGNTDHIDRLQKPESKINLDLFKVTNLKEGFEDLAVVNVKIITDVSEYPVAFIFSIR
jgi:hypothetical protein